jgi:hypothetical protein
LIFCNERAMSVCLGVFTSGWSDSRLASR